VTAASTRRYAIILLLFNIAKGAVMAATRIIYMICLNLCQFAILDKTTFPQGTEGLDPAYSSFVGMVFFAVKYRHPVITSLLVRHEEQQQRGLGNVPGGGGDSAAGDNTTRHCELPKVANPQVDGARTVVGSAAPGGSADRGVELVEVEDTANAEVGAPEQASFPHQGVDYHVTSPLFRQAVDKSKHMLRIATSSASRFDMPQNAHRGIDQGAVELVMDMHTMHGQGFFFGRGFKFAGIGRMGAAHEDHLALRRMGKVGGCAREGAPFSMENTQGACKLNLGGRV